MWIPSDDCGLRWTRAPVVPGSPDGPGRTWTPFGDLRIRRLRVRVAPGAPNKAPCLGESFACSCGAAHHRRCRWGDPREPFRQSGDVEGEPKPLAQGLSHRQDRSTYWPSGRPRGGFRAPHTAWDVGGPADVDRPGGDSRPDPTCLHRYLVGAGWKSPKVAPSGSRRTATSPVPGTVSGPRSTLPPSCSARDAAAETSSESK